MLILLSSACDVSLSVQFGYKLMVLKGIFQMVNLSEHYCTAYVFLLTPRALTATSSIQIRLVLRDVVTTDTHSSILRAGGLCCAQLPTEVATTQNLFQIIGDDSKCVRFLLDVHKALIQVMIKTYSS